MKGFIFGVVALGSAGLEGAYTRQMVGLESRPIRELRAWQKVSRFA